MGSCAWQLSYHIPCSISVWSPGFQTGGRKNGIYLLQYSGHLLLRPILVTYLRPTPKASQPSSVSGDLKLLFHGILLMEIFKQAPLPLQMNLGKDINIDDLRKMARKEFDAVKWGVCERFRQAVEACIEGNQGDKLDTPEDPEESFATTFCTRVINPLETDFTSLWGDRDPDQVLSELKLPSIKRKKPPPRGPKPVHLRVSSYLMSDWSNLGLPSQTQQGKLTPPTSLKPSMPTCSRLVTPVSSVGQLPIKFFDVVDSLDPRE